MLYITFAAGLNLPTQRVCISICVIYFVYFNLFLILSLFILGDFAFSTSCNSILKPKQIHKEMMLQQYLQLPALNINKKRSSNYCDYLQVKNIQYQSILQYSTVKSIYITVLLY